MVKCKCPCRFRKEADLWLPQIKVIEDRIPFGSYKDTMFVENRLTFAFRAIVTAVYGWMFVKYVLMCLVFDMPGKPDSCSVETMGPMTVHAMFGSFMYVFPQVAFGLKHPRSHWHAWFYVDFLQSLVFLAMFAAFPDNLVAVIEDLTLAVWLIGTLGSLVCFHSIGRIPREKHMGEKTEDYKFFSLR